MNYFLLFVILLVLSETPLSSSSPDLYGICSNQFKCGNVVADFPFWRGDQRPRGCGHPVRQLQCENNDTAILEINGVRFRVLEIERVTRRLKIARLDPEVGTCPQNITLYATPFVSPGYVNFTLIYDCTPQPFLENFSCHRNGVNSKAYVLPPGHPVPEGCSANATVQVPTLLPPGIGIGDWKSIEIWKAIEKALIDGFELEWKVDVEGYCKKCTHSKGRCDTKPSSNETICHCQEPARGLSSDGGEPGYPFQECRTSPPAIPPTAPPPDKKKISNLDIGLFIVGGVIAGILLGGGCLLWRQRRKRIAAQSQSKDLPATPSSNGPVPIPPSTKHSEIIHSYYHSSKSDLEKGSTYFGVQVFSYSELEEATHNFDPSKELGEGGFGTVYYGVLGDGRAVAVKRLFENNLKRVEQFMNEIKIVADTRHPNLVTLYGCTSRHSRELLLVYEYIPNGTVADHLHGRRAKSGLLTWPVRLSIAIETAYALAYLHGKEIIHRDVKTNNILLDCNFHVKVADFGLSRLFPNDVTHVSTAPQGTPGYVDPEYYQCYHLTDKSDVYSFGVVLIELISAKQAVDTNRHRYDINLANMAISRIQNQALNELVDPSLAFETDYAVRRMITTVAELAFQCLQQERDVRPSMEEVLAVLKGMQNEELTAQIAEVVDIGADDVGLLRHVPPPLSPDSAETEKWVQIRTM